MLSKKFLNTISSHGHQNTPKSWEAKKIQHAGKKCHSKTRAPDLTHRQCPHMT